MVKKREMGGQPGKKVGCPDRQWMLKGVPLGYCERKETNLKSAEGDSLCSKATCA